MPNFESQNLILNKHTESEAPAPATIGQKALPGSLAGRLAFTLKEAAQMLGISTKSVRRLIARGLIRRSKALRHVIIPRKELERFLEENMI